MTDRLAIGSNSPPYPIDPIPALETMLADLVEQVDGIPDIVNDEQAQQAQALLDDAKAAIKAVGGAKEAEKRPHLDANKAIDVAFNPLSLTAAEIKRTAEQKLAPWRQSEIDARNAAAQKARDEAAALLAQAQLARKSDDTATRIDGDLLLGEVVRSEQRANALEKQAKHTRTVWSACVDNFTELARWAWVRRRAEYEAFLQGIADTAARSPATRGAVPGVVFESEEKPI
jgi:hypothetical protein